jgi:protein TonB
MPKRKSVRIRKMLEFIYKNIKYPAIARENGVEGTVVVQFVVEKDGSIANAKVVRDIGAQCGQEAMRVVQMMNQKGLKWTPGKQRGRPVKVQFNLPVKFRLE